MTTTALRDIKLPEPEGGASGRVRLAVVGGFVALCLVIFSFLWVHSGGKLPLVTSDGYQVTATVEKVDNTVYFSDVMIAGVKVGKVRDVSATGEHPKLLIQLDEDIAPLHRGAKFSIEAKSLVEESYVSIKDGKGAEVPAGTVFPLSASTPPVKLNDVLASLDEPTRAELQSVLKSAGMATEDGKADISAGMSGLGDVGRDGRTALDALDAQSADLTRLTRSSTRVLAALAERRAQISSLVDDSNTIAQVTAGQQDDVSAAMQAFPGALDSARTSSGKLEELATHLDPVAKNLDASAPDLNAALEELPETTTSLRGLLPSLDTTLTRAPETLTKLPTTADRVDTLLPPASVVLSDLNPSLGYLEPYGRDLAAWFTNFAQTIATGDSNGRAFRVMALLNEVSVKGLPLNTNVGPLDKFNPLPAPGSLSDPGPNPRPYERVERER